MYEERFYRQYMSAEKLVGFNITEYESDLQIFASCDLSEVARTATKKFRNELQSYINNNPYFLASLKPVPVAFGASEIIKHMCIAASAANVGPMAAVAGAIAQYVGNTLLNHCNEVIIENGGDIFIKSKTARKILIYAGDSPFSNKIGIEIPGDSKPYGVCTSSGTLGHSLSFGKADAVVIISHDTLLADAVATSVCNIIKQPKDIEKGIQFAQKIIGILGVIIIIGDKLGIWGDIKLYHAGKDG